ncbi:MAG: hypothetical protein K8S14_02530 [Actinomycetia bacterium]|nr:hypothetical protein [Actinomycetes bacterium]
MYLKPMIAGTSIIGITPGKGIALCGYPRFDRKNIGTHDPLYASSLYLDNGNNRLLIICCDLV